MFFFDSDLQLLPALLVAALVIFAFRQNARLQALERRVGAIELGLPGQAPSGSVGSAPAASAPLPPEPTAAVPPPGTIEGTEPLPPESSWGSRSAARGSPIEPPPAEPALPGPPRAGLEERLGARWAVWVGGLALGLGGLLLVRYSIEQDLLGPGLKIALGALLAMALVGAGEWLRRREAPVALPAFPQANIPAVLTAAGTSTAFGVAYAAYALYGLIGPTAAFLLLGIIALVTMLASALHGPALAGLGLVAAFGAPVLVESADPNVAGLVAYLGFVASAAYGVARLRLWRWLAVASAAGALLWGVLIVGAAGFGHAVAHTLLQMALAIAFLVVDPYRRRTDELAVIDRLASAVLLAFGLLAIVVEGQVGIGTGRPLFAAATVAMLVAAGYRFPAVAPALAVASLVTIGTLAIWPVIGEADAEPVRVLDSIVGGTPMPEAVETYLLAALLLAGAVMAAGLVRVARGPDLRPAASAWYLGAATLGPLAALIVAYARIAALEPSIPFALAAAALGGAFASAARFFRAAEERQAASGASADTARLAVGATAAAALGALALGLTLALDRGILTVSLALAALGAAYVADRAAVPALRYVVGGLGLVVALRLAWDPRVVGGDLGTAPILNWLLFGYGVPALAFGLSARIMARGGRDRPVRIAETLAVLFSALLVFLQIRHAIHGDIYAGRTGHLEAGLVVTEGLGFSLLMARIRSRDPDPLFRIFSLGFAALSLAGAALALGLFSNPFFTGERISGGSLLNTLMPAYLIPAAMAALLARAAMRVHPRAFVLAAAGLALALELAYAFLETRALFQGPRIDIFRRTGDGELWAYSLVLLANGVALLAAGFWWNSREARIASAFCIVAAVLKVFVIDMASLEGLLRALSFVGLGLALVAIGFAYQKLMAGRGPGGPAEAP